MSDPRVSSLNFVRIVFQFSMLGHEVSMEVGFKCLERDFLNFKYGPRQRIIRGEGELAEEKWKKLLEKKWEQNSG